MYRVARGFVEYCHDNVWSPVCSHGYSATSNSEDWVTNDAKVACRHFGYSDEGARFERYCNISSQSDFIELECLNGSESSLFDCRRASSSSSCSCVSEAEVYALLMCNKAQCDNGNMRLVGGPTNREGRVETCVDGRWKVFFTDSLEGIAEPVCSDSGFPTADAESNFDETFFDHMPRGYFCYPNGSCTETLCRGSQSSAVHVICSDSQRQHCCADSEIKLNNKGRVEICEGGDWDPEFGDVCTEELFKDIRQMIEGITSMCSTTSSSTSKAIDHEGTTYSPSTNANPCICNIPTSQDQQTTPSQLQPSSQSSQLTTPLGAVLGVLLVLQVATLLGWTVTCVVLRKGTTRRRKFLNLPDPSVHRNECYSLHHPRTRSTATPLPPAPPDLHPISTIEGYTSISVQPNPNAGQVGAANPTSVGGEATDDFFNAEEYTYSVVDVKKKKAKKMSQERVERELPPDYEIALPGEVCWGEMEDELTQNTH